MKDPSGAAFKFGKCRLRLSVWDSPVALHVMSWPTDVAPELGHSNGVVEVMWTEWVWSYCGWARLCRPHKDGWSGCGLCEVTGMWGCGFWG